ncbi:cbb3-type cytochrome oxidase assembly protein CcoS [Crenobacter luteus]|uniref:Cytochrome C oxidase Cbb3 n=1 Tax=Crenobacter luteus TaxID=1452487 RepID=A0A161SL34_9NEIS|nr:cbb3-type cytochrome oxidase assembly protein CcoS [Crenobacter luteus]KZE35120.1 hypothetical protein AVW16_04875 [Crenobacter luteus]
MESLYLLIPMSIVLVFVIGALFWWATRSGQFDDLEGPGHRILMDDEKHTGDLNAADETDRDANQKTD